MGSGMAKRSLGSLVLFVLLEGRRELEQTGIDSLFREKFTSSFRQEIGVSAILKSVRANSQLPTNVSRYRAAQAHWIASKASGADHASKLLFSIVRLVLRRPAVATHLSRSSMLTGSTRDQ